MNRRLIVFLSRSFAANPLSEKAGGTPALPVTTISAPSAGRHLGHCLFFFSRSLRSFAANPSTALAAALIAAALVGCDAPPGKPKPEDKWQPASAVTDFATLYRQNCIACHGFGAVVSASIAMDSPTYLAAVPREVLVAATANGIPGSPMPAFSTARGGPLTDAQIEILADGILAKKPAASPAAPPPYAAAHGNPAAGASVFALACASCHGADGTGGDKAGSVVNPSYLALVSNQYLRTIVIAGRPELGCPDFASRIPGRPMTADEVSDVTAWLVSNRKNEFGEPLAPATPPRP
jgi:mono/diheme cytochrome c family protein